MPQLDPSKVYTFKTYLARAAGKLVARDLAREKLQEQINQLKKVASADIKGKIDELERRIVDAMARETKLRTHHESEDIFHRQLRDRMTMLERKIHTYLENREERLARVAELEQKVAERLSDRTEKLTALKMELQQLEYLAKEIAQGSKAAKKLSVLQERIESLKKDIDARQATV